MRRIISTILTLGLGCFSSVAAPDKADSDVACVWQVKSDTNTVYFVGALPFLRESDFPLPPQIRQAFDQAERVVFEIDPTESKDEQKGQDLIRMGMFADGASIKGSVSTKTYKALGDFLSDSGSPRAAMDSFRPWFAAVMISMTEMMKQGGRPNLGVGDTIEGWAAEAGKPWSGLEKMEVELELLQSMSKEIHEYMLKSTLDEVADADRMIEEMDEGLAAWRRGDTKTLVEMEEQDATEMDKQLERDLVRARGDKWLNQIEKTLAGDDIVLFSVGLGHLIGEGNLLSKLEAKGFEVSQLKAVAPKGKKPKQKDGDKKNKKPALIPVVLHPAA
ncbi:MAG: hypothetical protein ACI8XO_001431 [Verrucomicrobiales bacterium]|jgi:uncharacterized protein YbaP (TraB family)